MRGDELPAMVGPRCGCVRGGGGDRRVCERGAGLGGLGAEGAVLEQHAHAPVDDHAEGENEEQGGGLLDGNDVVQVIAGHEADEEEDHDDDEEGVGAAHHDGFAFADQVGGQQEGVGEDDGADEEGHSGPIPGNAEGGHEEHGKAGGHAERGNDDFAEGDGGAAFADAPEHDSEEPDDRGDDGCGQQVMHVASLTPLCQKWSQSV